jgi:uncharacterized membrane protein (GlpM family)
MSFVIATILLVLCLLICVFALIKGGQAERIGALIIIANLIAGVVNGRWLHDDLVHLAIAGVTALVLLAVAVRYASFWLGGVMLLYALQFALDAYYIILEQKRDDLFMVVNNALFSAVTLCLAIGTALTLRRRAELAKQTPAA